MDATERNPIEITGETVKYDLFPKAPPKKIDTRRRARSKRHSKKQAAQLDALNQVHTTTWATAILLSACNVAYDMLRERGWEDEDATAFARRMAEKTGEKLGETLAGVTA